MKPLLFVTDPWNTLTHATDTTIRLIEAALAKKVPCFWSDVTSIGVADGQVRLEVRAVLRTGPAREANLIKLGPARDASPREFAQVHYRTDPPIDLHYLHPLQLLELSGANLVNPARALFALNEKVVASVFGKFAPRSLVSAREDALFKFLAREKRAVLKPLHEAQSKGIHRLEVGDANAARALLREATGGFAQPVLLQQFLPGIAQGETRLWFVDGKLLATARKLPLGGDFRVQIDLGSRVEKATLAPHEKRAATWTAGILRKWKVRLAAVDLIEGLVTDFNLTSPGLIVQMEAALGRDLATPIVTALLKKRA